MQNMKMLLKIDIDLYLELPIQELSKLANRLAQISNELSK